ncbi:calcium/sodium antiporter [Candidatus Sumerlaeota bacterium]|nr:calcium/sodium antiporter [Candidatus Sumerlaeota bacterium]
MFNALSPWLSSPWFLTAVGFVFLWLGAEALIRGSSRLAEGYGISPLLVGLTVVAFGTSLPELGVCLIAAYREHTDFAVGNIVGSNIANIGLIIGLSAILKRIRVRELHLRIDLNWALAAAVIIGLWSWTSGSINHIHGLIMLGLFLVYLIQLIRRERAKSMGPAVARVEMTGKQRIVEALFVLLGLILLPLGAHFLIEGATELAQRFGVSELVIGLTLLAVGTSLPELATGIVGVMRGQGALVLGNVIGSNIFNVFLVLGVTATVINLPIDPAARNFSIPAMILFSFGFMAICWQGKRISNLEGFFLLLAYGIYVWMLF